MTSHRGTLFLESAEVLSHTAFEGDQFIIRLQAPKAAAAAVPGSFAHLRCGPDRPMRRPLSIMRSHDSEGWIELLYKPVGAGLRELTEAAPGTTLSVLAPIGNGFSPDPARRNVLAIGGGVGIPPMVFLAETLAAGADFETLVLMGSEVPVPFATVPTRLALDRLREAGHETDARSIADLESAGIPSLLASNSGLPGAIAGFVPDLARDILKTASDSVLASTQICACGPEPMLRATARLAADFGLPCELALEEYMACATGGCAGCAVAVHRDGQVMMKRVCVDGPVFAAKEIYPA